MIKYCHAWQRLSSKSTSLPPFLLVSFRLNPRLLYVYNNHNMLYTWHRRKLWRHDWNKLQNEEIFQDSDKKTVGHSNTTFKAPANAQYLNSKIIQISSAHRALRMENCFSLNSTHAVNGNYNFFRILSERKPDKPKISRSCLLVTHEHSNFPRHFLWNLFA